MYVYSMAESTNCCCCFDSVSISCMFAQNRITFAVVIDIVVCLCLPRFEHVWNVCTRGLRSMSVNILTIA